MLESIKIKPVVEDHAEFYSISFSIQSDIPSYMKPLKLLEALVNQTASICAIVSKTGANTSECFTPHAVRLFDKDRGHSKECVPLFFVMTFLVEGILCGSATVNFLIWGMTYLHHSN